MVVVFEPQFTSFLQGLLELFVELPDSAFLDTVLLALAFVGQTDCWQSAAFNPAPHCRVVHTIPSCYFTNSEQIIIIALCHGLLLSVMCEKHAATPFVEHIRRDCSKQAVKKQKLRLAYVAEEPEGDRGLFLLQ